MNNQHIPGIIISFILYLLLQVTVVRNMVLFDTAFCYVYVAFLILLPFEIRPVLLMIIAFLCGIMIDIFYDSLGIHAAACVLIAFIRPFWTKTVPPRGGYEMGMKPTIRIMGFSWFLTFTLPLILIHHLVLFFVEAGGLHLFGFTLVKVISSTILTFLVMVILQYLFYRSTRGL
ncbi:MAG: rod shape-determining protein MreD [Cyclobacteriaceae bacterium]|nr:MAG: rod shape-determining protein MreD [Cyclobacteriaceae bacterium]